MNVVFDLGGVVVNWHLDRVLRSHSIDDAIAGRVKSALILHRDWSRFDIGVITSEELATAASERAGVAAGLLLALLQSLSKAFSTIEETMQIIRRLRATGHRTFCLSNMPAPFYAHLVRVLPFNQLFEGRVISSEVGLGKPDEAIFSHLLTTFDLDARYTLFFDDHIENCQAARLSGIDGVHFSDAAGCRQFLASKDIILF